MNYQLASSWLLHSHKKYSSARLQSEYCITFSKLTFYFRMGFCKTLKEFHSMNSIAKFSEICSQFIQAFFTTSLQSIKYKLAQTNFKKNILLYLKKRYMKTCCLSQKWYCLCNIHSKEGKNRAFTHPCFLHVSRLCSHSR